MGHRYSPFGSVARQRGRDDAKRYRQGPPDGAKKVSITAHSPQEALDKLKQIVPGLMAGTPDKIEDWNELTPNCACQASCCRYNNAGRCVENLTDCRDRK